MRHPISTPPHLERANLAKLPIVQRLWEDPGVKELEQVPFGARLRLEVPEDPAAGMLLEDFELSLDVASHVVLERVAPGLDEVHVLA